MYITLTLISYETSLYFRDIFLSKIVRFRDVLNNVSPINRMELNKINFYCLGRL